MNLIFLDVDGVLNSSAYFDALLEDDLEDSARYEICEYYLQMLAKIYHECQAQIVLSSSWRTLQGRDDREAHSMYRYLEDSLARYGMQIMSQTPVIGMDRPKEISAWLDSRTDRDQLRFVSLDDNFEKADYARYGIAHCLVRTNFVCDTLSGGGLCKRQAARAIHKLKWHPALVRVLSYME